MTREEVIKWLKSKLEKIDINLGDIEYNCYSMEHNQLKKYEEHYDMDDNIDTRVSGTRKMTVII